MYYYVLKFGDDPMVLFYVLVLFCFQTLFRWFLPLNFFELVSAALSSKSNPSLYKQKWYYEAGQDAGAQKYLKLSVKAHLHRFRSSQ